MPTAPQIDAEAAELVELAVRIPADVAAALGRAAELRGCSAGEEAAAIIWRALRPALAVDHLAAAAALRAGDLASWRMSILDRWREAVASRMRGLGQKAATREFLAELKAEGTDLCESTLYGWDKRRREGLTLADRRALRADFLHPFDTIVDRVWASGRFRTARHVWQEACRRAERTQTLTKSEKSVSRRITRLRRASESLSKGRAR